MDYTSHEAHLTSRQVYEFISKSTCDPIVERRTCSISGQPFAIFQSDLDFYNKISPTFAGQRFQIPTPTLCPEERQRRRLVFRNERKLYRRTCDYSGKDIISIYSPEKLYKVYEKNIRRSDKWDPMDYGLEFNSSKLFSEQFGNLWNTTPQISLTATENQNAEYAHLSAYNKDCYLLFAGEYNRDCYYSSRIIDSENCIDTLELSKCKESYKCINIEECSNIFYSEQCKSCSYCRYMRGCMNCHDCILCTNLVNQSYCIMNRQYSKEEYRKKKQEMLSWSIVDIMENFILFSQESTYRSNIITHSESSIGNNILWSVDCIYCFDTNDTQSAKYVYSSFKTKTMMDVSNTTEQELWYEGVSIGYKSIKCMFTYGGRTCSDLYYCYDCHNSHNLFGCVSLRDKQYCIFNKQYTKEEYEIQVAKIITHMQETWERWEFFCPSLSPFGYNETVANEYFPLTREEALSRWYQRQDNNYDPIIPEGAKVIDWRQESPLTPRSEEEEILNSIFICEVSWRPYRIIKQELEFYRKHHLPLPKRHPDVRHEERIKLRPWRTLYLRNCDKCNKEMLSVYQNITEGSERPDKGSLHISESSESHQKVYCEECYTKEIYS